MSEMLFSFLIELETLEPATLNGYGGEALHGLFFEILRDYSKKVFDVVHNESRKPKPFSLSGVLEKKTRSEGRLFLSAGEHVSFRIAVLEEKLIPDVLASFAKALNLKTKLSLSNGRIIIKNISYQEGSSPWVKSTLYPKLFEEAKARDRVNLRFISPTSFRVKGNQCTLPLAALIFGSLLEKWNTFSGIRFKAGFLEKLEAAFPSQFQLRSELVEFSNYRIIGFRGEVEYRLGKDFTREEKKQLNALADFAFYAGVGYKTTMGMGQTIKVKSNRD